MRAASTAASETEEKTASTADETMRFEAAKMMKFMLKMRKLKSGTQFYWEMGKAAAIGPARKAKDQIPFD